MNKQMEMSFMRKGGLKDDGLNEDPVSGNKVPSGSMAKEVRDDIPAMLSEGEYVVPADVLRFYGVNFFEDLRNKAKSGLTSMEKNGRIGGTPLSQEDISRNMQQSMQPPSQPMPPVPPQLQAVNQGGFMEQPVNMQQQQQFNDPYLQQQTMYQVPPGMSEGGGTSGITESPRVRKDPFRPTPEEEEGLRRMDANPKSREDIEEPRATIKTFEVDGRMKNAIVFKDGEKMFSDEILRRFQDSVSASEPIVGKETSRIIDQYLGEANPTKEEFIRYFFEQRRLANGGVIGASNGPDMGTYTSGYNPATARYAMFQGTSSQQQAQAAAEEAAVGEEITYSRIHYNSKGQFITIQYVGTDEETAIPAEGQNQQLKDYPLTEDEWKALQKEMANSGDGDGGGTDPDSVAAGSSTEWMKGIDFNSSASVKEWAEDALGMSAGAKKLAGMGGILGAIPQGIQANDIAKVRGLADLYAQSNPEFSAELDSMANDAVKNSGSLLISAFDKLGLMTGKGYAGNEELGKRIQFGQETQAETKKILGSSGGSGSDDPTITETAISDEEARRIASDDPFDSRDSRDPNPVFGGTRYTFTDDDDDDSIFDDIDAQFEAAGVGQNKGGLATKRKTKNKSPKKTGLAGKR